MWNAQGGIFYLTRLLTKDSTQEFLFRCQLGLTFGSNLADENILWANLSTHINDAALVEILQTFLTNVGDVTCNLFGTEFCITSINLIFLNVYRGKVIFTHDTLTDQNGIFVVATLPAHKGNQDVLAECQFAVLR